MAKNLFERVRDAVLNKPPQPCDSGPRLRRCAYYKCRAEIADDDVEWSTDSDPYHESKGCLKKASGDYGDM